MAGGESRERARKSNDSPVLAMDRTDHRLLHALRTEGRMSVSELARIAHVSRATAYIRLERLQSSGVIQGYSARVDHRRMGIGTTAVILVTVRQNNWQSLIDAVKDFEELEYLSLMAGPFDALMVVRTSSIDTLKDVVLGRLQALPFVRSTQTSFVLEEVVRRPYIIPRTPPA